MLQLAAGIHFTVAIKAMRLNSGWRVVVKYSPHSRGSAVSAFMQPCFQDGSAGTGTINGAC